MLIIVILEYQTSDDHLCKKKKIQEYSCVKGILNQQELPTIADCQVLRIGFIDHQILLIIIKVRTKKNRPLNDEKIGGKNSKFTLFQLL